MCRGRATNPSTESRDRIRQVNGGGELSGSLPEGKQGPGKWGKGKAVQAQAGSKQRGGRQRTKHWNLNPRWQAQASPSVSPHLLHVSEQAKAGESLPAPASLS